MNSIEKAIERLNQKPKQKEAATHPPPSANKTNISQQQVAEVKPKPELQLNLKALAQAGYLTSDTMQGSLAEQYRLLKRPLLRNANSRHENRLESGNLIAVTSALLGEGKTFTALNLAMSIAIERDTTVLLLDSDLIARSLTCLVGLDDALGLTDILLDPQISLQDVIFLTNVPHLRLLPAGHSHANATELLASERMSDVVRELSARYNDRIILFDTSPILATSQATVLTYLVGQILVVVEEGKTSQHVIQDAIALLDQQKVIGMVLNKSLGLSSSKYYPHYGVS